VSPTIVTASGKTREIVHHPGLSQSSQNHIVSKKDPFYNPSVILAPTELLSLIGLVWQSFNYY
jgi:hypothetical protein